MTQVAIADDIMNQNRNKNRKTQKPIKKDILMLRRRERPILMTEKEYSTLEKTHSLAQFSFAAAVKEDCLNIQWSR